MDGEDSPQVTGRSRAVLLVKVPLMTLVLLDSDVKKTCVFMKKKRPKKGQRKRTAKSLEPDDDDYGSSVVDPAKKPLRAGLSSSTKYLTSSCLKSLMILKLVVFPE